MPTNERIAELKARYGFDRPIPVQYILYIGGLARGDWGRSWTTSNPVLEDIRRRFPATLELSLLALAARFCSPFRSASRPPGGRAPRSTVSPPRRQRAARPFRSSGSA